VQQLQLLAVMAVEMMLAQLVDQAEAVAVLLVIQKVLLLVMLAVLALPGKVLMVVQVFHRGHQEQLLEAVAAVVKAQLVQAQLVALVLLISYRPMLAVVAAVLKILVQEQVDQAAVAQVAPTHLVLPERQTQAEAVAVQVRTQLATHKQ
jgi:hypothetical protein